MFSSLVNYKFSSTLLSIPNITIFWCCRCHHVVEYGTTDHEHHHALVQYNEGFTQQAFKKCFKDQDKDFTQKQDSKRFWFKSCY